MEIKWILQSQYGAALAMLEQVVQKCPASLWDDDQCHNRVWRVAFHVLFFTHLYLAPTEAEYVKWPKHRDEAQHLGPIFWENNREPVVGDPYTPAEILEYLNFCRDLVTQQVPQLDLAAASGFDWLPMTKLELQFYNIRHLTHHTGELYDRLGSRAGVELPWIGNWPREPQISVAPTP